MTSKAADFTKCPTCGGLRAGPKIVVVPAAKGEAYCRDPFHPNNYKGGRKAVRK